MTSGPVPQYSPRRAQDYPELMVPGVRLPEPRGGLSGSAPAWPSTMITPSEVEEARWAELWRNPQAGQWAQAGQEHDVATLVRAEARCGSRRPSAWARAEVDRLRVVLGLGERRRWRP